MYNIPPIEEDVLSFLPLRVMLEKTDVSATLSGLVHCESYA